MKKNNYFIGIGVFLVLLILFINLMFNDYYLSRMRAFNFIEFLTPILITVIGFMVIRYIKKKDDSEDELTKKLNTYIESATDRLNTYIRISERKDQKIDDFITIMSDIKLVLQRDYGHFEQKFIQYDSDLNEFSNQLNKQDKEIYKNTKELERHDKEINELKKKIA